MSFHAFCVPQFDEEALEEEDSLYSMDMSCSGTFLS